MFYTHQTKNVREACGVRCALSVYPDIVIPVTCAAIAYSQHNDRVDNAHKAGYVEVAETR
jgi:hypothetical protein